MPLVKNVFVAGGMPSVTYVDRAALRLEHGLQSEINEGYKVICVTGPTKSGKTVLTRHVLGRDKSALVNGGQVEESQEFWTLLLQDLRLPEIETDNDSSESVVGLRYLVSAQAKASEGTTQTFSNNNKRTILDYMRENDLALVVDDFHYMPQKVQREIVRSLKSEVFEGLTAILIAVPHRAFDAIGVEREMEGRFAHVEIPTWSNDELKKIAQQGFPALNVKVDERCVEEFAEESSGSPLLTGITRLTGTGRTKLDLSGSGGSMHALMSSLSGTGSVELGDGQIKGIDLAAMMRNLKNAFGGFEGATDFTSLTGTFEMDRGVLQNVDLSLVSPLFRAGGRGSIDVGARAMNYEVTPMRLAEGAEFTVPVMITGPWNNLRFRPDLEALADLLLNSDFENSEELRRAREKLQEVRAVLDDPEAAIEDRLRKELERKLLGGIGTPPVAQPDTTGDETAALTPAPEAASQSLEDTVKDGVRNRLLEELGLRREPEAAPEAQQLPVQTPQAGAGTGSGSPLALSTPGTRPRLRPAGLDTSATPLEASVDTVGTEATVQPEPEPDTRSGEERLKDAVEDAAKNELRKLLGLGE